MPSPPSPYAELHTIAGGQPRCPHHHQGFHSLCSARPGPSPLAPWPRSSHGIAAANCVAASARELRGFLGFHGSARTGATEDDASAPWLLSSSDCSDGDNRPEICTSRFSIHSLSVNGISSGIATEASSSSSSDLSGCQEGAGDCDKASAYDESNGKRAELVGPDSKLSYEASSFGHRAAEEHSHGKLIADDGEAEMKGDDAVEDADKAEFYDPNAGDVVLGVVVSLDKGKLHLDIGSKKLGLMLAKDILPFHQSNLDNAFYCLPNTTDEKQHGEMAGKSFLVTDEREEVAGFSGEGPRVDRGTVVMAEVLGNMQLSGTPLLSARSLARKIAFDRVKQLQAESAPIEVPVTRWNFGGVLCEIEGLQAFLPLSELLVWIDHRSSLKKYVGKKLPVVIKYAAEENMEIIVSEMIAWEKQYIRQGVLHDGTIIKVAPYGLLVQIANTRVRGLVHISNVSRCKRVGPLEELFSESEKVKVLVIGRKDPYKVILSIADLESKSGLIIEDKEQVFREAEEMARLYRENVSQLAHDPELKESGDLEFQDPVIANYKWMGFKNLII